MPEDAAPPEKGKGEEIDETVRPTVLLRRDANLIGRRDSACRKWLYPRIEAIVRGFEDQAARSDDLDGWWNIYNCQLDGNQFYNGNAEVYVPIIHDAINARVTRFSNQLFPQVGRYVDATATDGKIPHEILALVHHYIEDAKLKTAVVKPLLRNGDIEGQYNLYLGWEEVERHLVSRETRTPVDPQTGIEMVGAEVVDIVEEEVVFGRPTFEVPHDSDVLVLPATADSVEGALAAGGSVTIVRRWSKEEYRRKVDDKEIEGREGDEDGIPMVEAGFAGLSDLGKKLARAVGVRAKGPHFLAFETWMMVPLDERGAFGVKGKKRLCRLWWGIEREPLGLHRNPHWNDRCPLLSAPVEKVAGVFKGKSQVEALAPLQYEANDAANERADTDHYGAMPIIRRSPGEGNGPLILNLAAVWDAPPGAVEFLAFPDLSQRANARIMAATTVIFQSLGINPSMLPQQTGRPGAKRNQAEVALEQTVDILTVAEAVEVPDQNILSPLAGWIVDLDHQFRSDRDLDVRAFGELGLSAEMISIPPIESHTHYRFSWCGAQQAKQNAAMQQQGIGLLNVARGLAPQLQAEGYQLRLGPAVERMFANVLGPEIGRLVLIDQRHQLGLASEVEIDLMLNGFVTHPHPLDNDQEKIMAFRQAMMGLGDPHGTLRARLAEQLAQAQAKARALGAQQMMQQMGGGGVGPGGPGGPGAPQPGAAAAGPRLLKGPPGQIHPDQMPRAGAVPMPRRM